MFYVLISRSSFDPSWSQPYPDEPSTQWYLPQTAKSLWVESKPRLLSSLGCPGGVMGILLEGGLSYRILGVLVTNPGHSRPFGVRSNMAYTQFEKKNPMLIVWCRCIGMGTVEPEKEIITLSLDSPPRSILTTHFSHIYLVLIKKPENMDTSINGCC